MRLIDADALKERLQEDDIPATGIEREIALIVRDGILQILDAAPTVCCEECVHQGAYPAPCGLCTPSKLRFERRTP